MPTGAALSRAYAASGHVFVALRLRSGATTNSIRPIVLRMADQEPCLPIRLTSIATVPGLPIRAYFLAEDPAVPTNYSLLDAPDQPALYSGALAWTEAHRTAVTEAGGQAFVLDYVGSPPAISLEVRDLDDLRGQSLEEVAASLNARLLGLAENLADLLARFVVPTNGLEPLAFAQLCLQSFICDGATFDEEGFFAALAEEIVRPRRRAQAWLAEHRTLTRLYTSMSAEDMTLDPEFRFDAGIEPVSNVHTADVVTLCDPTQYQLYAPQEIRLADGTRAVFRAAIPIVDDDAFCRAQGSPGADDGCNLHVGADRSTTRALAIASMVLLALGLRRRRRASLSGPRSGRLET